MTDTTTRKSSHEDFEVLDQGDGKVALLCTRLVTIQRVRRPCNGTLYPVDVQAADDEGGRVVRFQCHRCRCDLVSYVYAHESLVYPLQHGVVRDVMNLASGTISVIARSPVHEKPASTMTCEAIQRTWWAWVEDRAWNAITYERWQDAWEDWVLYQNEGPTPDPVFGTDAEGNDTFDPAAAYNEAVYGDAVAELPEHLYLSRSLVVSYLRAEYDATKAGGDAWMERSRIEDQKGNKGGARYAHGMAQALASAAARFQRTLKELTGEEVR